MKKREQGNLFLTLDALVPLDHPYRKLDELLPFDKLSLAYQGLYSSKGRKEKGFEFAIRALIIQFMEDLSDREMERYLQENLTCKWFCDMNLGEEAADHSYFGDFRKHPGTGRLMDIFSQVRNSLQGMGLIREIFTFVDASQLISKLTTWDDRDRAIKQGLEQFNNETAGKVATDKQARFGCKGKNTYWFGYKEHVSVDMQSGLINKVAATSAGVTDVHGFQHVCPNGGAVYADKGYGLNPVKITLKRKGCHDGDHQEEQYERKESR